MSMFARRVVEVENWGRMEKGPQNSKHKIIDFKLLAIVLLCCLPVPTVTWLSSTWIEHSQNSDFLKGIVQLTREKYNKDIANDSESLTRLSLPNMCADFDLVSKDPAMNQICSQRNNIETLGDFAVLTFALTIFVLIGITAAGFLCRLNRFLLLVIFRLGLLATQLSVAALVVLNAGLVIATVYWLEVWLIGRVHYLLIGGVGIVAVGATLSVLKGAFTFTHKAEARVFGKRLGRMDYPDLWNFVDTVAKEAGTSSPDHIVLGLEPSFFVTEANVYCLDGKLHGRTLFLSLPFCRLLMKKELASIVGHEMGHFVGKDTAFSRWFFPIYRGASDTTRTLFAHMGGEKNGLHTLALLPPFYTMMYFFSSFSRAESEISRERELAADRLGAMIGGSDAMASALVKVHAYSNIWPYTQKKMGEALGQGKQIINACLFFESIACTTPIEVFSEGLGSSHTDHPTDSHPALSLRLSALDCEPALQIPSTLVGAQGLPSLTEGRAMTLVNNYEALERELTDLEHYKIMKAAGIKIPESAPEATKTGTPDPEEEYKKRREQKKKTEMKETA